MTAKSRILAMLILATAVLVWRYQDQPPKRLPATPPPNKSVVSPSTPESPSPSALLPEQARVTESAATVSPPQRVLDAIDNLEFTFRDFSNALGGNPVGTNAEITAALLGDNLKQIKLPIPEGSTRNVQGELCDPWGSPWFFHQLSGTKMEIRSAGPDRTLYTGDDFIR